MRSCAALPKLRELKAVRRSRKSVGAQLYLSEDPIATLYFVYNGLPVYSRSLRDDMTHVRIAKDNKLYEIPRDRNGERRIQERFNAAITGSSQGRDFWLAFMYEGVHNQHHAKRYYGTVNDPEYLPLALMKPWTLPVFLLVSVLMPIGLLLRFGVLGPLSLLSPRLRKLVVGRYSGLQINPAYERRAPEGEFAKQWRWQEIGASLWAIALIALVATG